MKRNLFFEETYPYPIERVWRAISDSAAIADWLMPNDFQPVLGHKFQFRSKPQPGWDGIVHCEVIDLDPPRRLGITWKSANSVDTVVTFTLESVPDGTRLRLEHTGFSGLKAVMISYILGSGWKDIVRKHIPAVVGRMPEDKPAQDLVM
ncbi:MAG TPA: SRPBCC domain-containing protein [Blastocatellia bacterium]|nr:SRPBCC domain-containing protein [Blastocatellia bacterium]